MSSEFLYAIIVGLIIGLVTGLLKSWLLWRRNNPFNKDARKMPSTQGIVLRFLFSYLLDVIVLGVVFIARSFINLPLTPLLIATASGLIICSLLYPLQNMFSKQ
ncbi:MAG: hypothetical protein FWG61_00040 [Firmicutes bacterium]|nr:hypothetical protein [Bacillota bacterium]